MAVCLKREIQKTQISNYVRLFEYVLAVAKLVGEEKAWRVLCNLIVDNREKWLQNNWEKMDVKGIEVERAYNIFLLKYLNLDPNEVPIVKKTKKKIVYRSYNFCPVLEACRTLNLDTKRICRLVYEEPAQRFLTGLNPKLRFKRNYEKIRPR